MVILMSQILPILALLCGVLFMMLGVGLHGVLLPIRGTDANFTSYDLGWLGAGYAIGFTIGCIVIPHLVRRVGHVRTFGALMAIVTVTILLTGLDTSPLFWIILRSISGFCIAGCYMVVESWLNERSSNESRGSIFSIYTVVALAALMGGQYMLVLDDVIENPLVLFMICAMLYALAVVPTAVSKAQSPAPLTHVKLDLRKLYFNSPSAFVGAFICGIISAAWISFGPVFGSRVDMSNAEIATLLGVTMIGSLIFQYPLGRLSDIIDRRYVMVLAGIVGVCAGTALSFLGAMHNFSILFYGSAVCYGAVIFSIYSLVIAHANDYADAGDFVETSSGMLIVYGLGTIAGPLMTAFAMDMLGPSGVFTTTTIAHLAIAAYALYRTFRRDRAKESDRGEFQSTGLTKAHTPESYALDPRSDESESEEESLEQPEMLAPIKVES